MGVVDICLLGAKVATIDEQATVRIEARGSALPLSAREASQFSRFLRVQEPRLTAASGGQPLHERVLVWRPEAARAALSEHFRTVVWPFLATHPGRAFITGQVTVDGLMAFYYGGFSPDSSCFVLVRDELFELRYRELLVAACAKQSGGASNLFWLASLVASEELQDDPIAGQGSPIVAEARLQAQDTAYWLEFAGPEPTAGDERDARRSRPPTPQSI